MIDQISALNPPIKIQSRFLKKKADADLYAAIDGYLDDYCAYYSISAEEAEKGIKKFNERYQRDLKHFYASGRYPADEKNADFDLTREEYDLFLISSMLFTTHRYGIAEELRRCSFAEDSSAAFIGFGSGVEYHIISDKFREAAAFDISFSGFVRDRYKNITLVEKEFNSENVSGSYDVIFAVELLEHIEKPQILIADMERFLKPEGTVVCTFAFNVPQFDHAVNMTPEVFEGLLCDKFRIDKKTDIVHDYKMASIESKNIIYHLKKRG